MTVNREDREAAYAAFITQAQHNLADPSDELVQAVITGDISTVMVAVRKMVFDAESKAKLLFCGSPPGTILRHKVTGDSATRILTPGEGIPAWIVTRADGGQETWHEAVLMPEDDWKCIHNPEEEES